MAVIAPVSSRSLGSVRCAIAGIATALVAVAAAVAPVTAVAAAAAPTSAAATSTAAAGPILAPATPAPDPATLEPGITFRVWDVDRPLERVHEPAPDQSPNLDQLRPVVDYPAQGDFGGFGDRFVVEVRGWLRITEPGRHVFRLVSDDGSLLRIDGQRIVWNRGLHAAQARDGDATLEPGLYPFDILMFEHEGGEHLSFQWQPPSADGFTVVPSEHLRTERNVTRVVAPGPKRLLDEIKGLRAGDGLVLASPHPSYRIQTIHPDDFDPMVGGLAVLPDGRLLVATFEPKNNGVRLTEPNGTIWALSNLDADDPNDIDVAVFAEGFFHPLGLCLVDGDLYVAERDGITRLWDADGDGAFESREAFAGGWTSDNYHHFTFGLEHHEGALYATLSTSIGANDQEIRTGEIIGINGPNPPHRGTLVRVGLANRTVSYLAGGFRTPNGVLVRPDGHVFVGDNQGAWMPENRIYDVRPGRFYGHYNETRVRTDRYPDGGAPSMFSDRIPSPPAIRLPHNEIANSPTDFLLLDDGPYADHLLVSDVKLGGLRRVFFDEVDGELQGGAVRHSQGFEGGTNRLLEMPDGSIVVGCIGEQATWSWRGTRTGLQRLVPTGIPCFEIHSMRATADGFVVRFTDAVPREQLENAAGWSIRQWRTVPGPEYGGPKFDEEGLVATRAVPSGDRRSVTLDVPGLKAGYVVHARFDATSDAGERLWSPEVWYTLNRIPEQADPLAELPSVAPIDAGGRFRVLVFSKTAGFRHGSIPAGIAALQELGDEYGFDVDATEDARVFNDPTLANYRVVVFCNTTGNVLDLSQEAALQRWVQAGGGWMGIHSAADTEYDWPWYGGLVGSYFRSHPAVQEATIDVVDREHPSTRHLGAQWVRTDEWYDFRARPAARVRRLLMLDESTYEGGKMGDDHPIAWCHEYDGGRAFYTGGGHTVEAYSEPDFRRHLAGGIMWAADAPMPAGEDGAGGAAAGGAAADDAAAADAAVGGAAEDAARDADPDDADPDDASPAAPADATTEAPRR